MPHLILETSADLPENTGVSDILEALVAELSPLETVNSKDIKAYHRLYSNWKMGAGAPSGFAHLTLKVLAGRSEELRRSFADHMYAVLSNCFAESRSNGDLSLTLEIVEMTPATYRKA